MQVGYEKLAIFDQYIHLYSLRKSSIKTNNKKATTNNKAECRQALTQLRP